VTPEARPGETYHAPGTGSGAAFGVGFVVMRVPLLAVDTLTNWAQGVRAGVSVSGPDVELAEALAADRAMLRARLSALLDDEQISGSLAVSSPDLAWGISRWRAHPGTRRAESAERSLVRYLTRMACRCSPFGLASGYIVGDVVGEPALEVESRSNVRAVTRIDVGLLQEIMRDTVSKALDSEELLLRRNPGVYRAAGRLRVAARTEGSNKHRLVAMRSAEAIEAVLEAAHPQAAAGELIKVVQESGASPEDARALLARLLRSELLIPVTQVTVTGAEPTAQAIAGLRSVPGGEHAAEVLGDAVRALEAADGDASRMPAAVAEHISRLRVEVSPRRCVQVDSIRTGKIVLPRAVLEEAHRATGLLAQITPKQPDPHLRSFCERFQHRFGARSVPLLEALDPDSGLVLEDPAGHHHDPAGAAARKAVLLALIERGHRAPHHEVELTRAELAALSQEPPARLPAAFACVFKLIGRDAGLVAAGEFALVAPQVVGPSGVRLLGRMCHGDEELEGRVRDYIAREAALHPDAVMAEVCTAPDTDWGLNVTHRPVLRDWEIECGGYSGAPPAQRLEPADLLVTVAGDEVVLSSAALGRRVLPCWTNALNHKFVSLPAARFLALVASQGFSGGLGWDWGDLADAPMLPRVRHGRTVLTLRRWSMSAAEVHALNAGTDAAGFRRLAEWRRAHELPRFAHLVHGKNTLLIDFDNVLSVDAFIAVTGQVDRLRFVEAPEVDSSPVAGPDGRYAHEFVLPCTGIGPAAPAVSPVRRVTVPVPERSRRFEPGSEWLYSNLYGPKSVADGLLTETIAPLRDRLRRAELIDRWFFIRYADPDRHLRVRFHGRPRDLLREVLPALHEAIEPALDQGVLYRVSLDTYEREVERYGGLRGVELMEAAAEADSDAVLEVLRHAMTPAERRWLTVASLAALYADSGLTLEVRRQCCADLRRTWSRGGEGSIEALLGADARRERARVETAVASLDAPGPPPPVQALRARSDRLQVVFAQLGALEEAGELNRPLAEVVCALAHMSVNRLLREGGSHDELRVHDALGRLYASQLARARSGARS
jgi:lantibiotic biosynthesis protein